MADSILSRLKPRSLLKVSAGLLALGNAGLVFFLVAPTSDKFSEQRRSQPLTVSVAEPTDISALTSAPLFDPSRRAAPTAVAETVTEEAPLKLTPKGTSISGDQRAVVLSGGGEPIVLREGESRYGVKIIEISAKSVTMETNSGRRTVALVGF